MKRSSLFGLLVLVVGGILAAFFAMNRPSLPATEPLVAGTITQIENGRALIEELPGQQSGDKCWFALSDKTQVLIQQDGKLQKAPERNLIPGQQVKAWAGGPVLESYPCQTTAGTILLLK